MDRKELNGKNIHGIVVIVLVFGTVRVGMTLGVKLNFGNG